MKVIQFTIPVSRDNSVIVEDETLPYFYSHLHRHKEMQVTWIIDGEGTLIAGNYMQPFRSGDIYVLGANLPHVFKCDPAYFDKRKKKQVHSLSILYSVEGFFQQLLELPETKSIRKFISGASSGLQIPESAKNRVMEEMFGIKETKQGFRIAAFIRLMQTLSDIKECKKLATETSGYSFSDMEGLRMNDVYQFTMEHYAENIKLRQVADIAYLTPQAFCRYFKKHTRKTYIVFLSEIRISEACKKIIAGDFDSMSSIAYDTGFSSAVSFNRVFKKFTGKSPRQYLAEYREKAD